MAVSDLIMKLRDSNLAHGLFMCQASVVCGSTYCEKLRDDEKGGKRAT